MRYIRKIQISLGEEAPFYFIQCVESKVQKHGYDLNHLADISRLLESPLGSSSREMGFHPYLSPSHTKNLDSSDLGGPIL